MRLREITPSWLHARRVWLLVLLILVAQSACGRRASSEGLVIHPPDQFSDESGEWERSSDSLSNRDIQKIGRFFDQNPDLIGSPDWTGQPEKYFSKDTRSLARFYWFSGSAASPYWNALELNGTRIRDLSGEGVPGESIENKN